MLHEMTRYYVESNVPKVEVVQVSDAIDKDDPRGKSIGIVSDNTGIDRWLVVSISNPSYNADIPDSAFIKKNVRQFNRATKKFEVVQVRDVPNVNSSAYKNALLWTPPGQQIPRNGVQYITENQYYELLAEMIVLNEPAKA